MIEVLVGSHSSIIFNRIKAVIKMMINHIETSFATDNTATTAAHTHN